MRLALSSAAAPDAGLSELLEACTRRGLGALELRAGDAHGIAPGDPFGAVDAAGRASAAGVLISGFRASSGDDLLHLARLAEALGAPLLLEGGSVAERAVRAQRLADSGTEVVLVVGGPDAVHQASLVADMGLAFAWDAAPGQRPVGEDAQRLLDERGGKLTHITLLGGGPEAALHEGRGVGELMGRLALAGFTGTLTLAPASRKYHVAWETWLGRRGGWGCGSRQQDGSLVNLAGGR
jgi:hypothetical protein